MVMLGLKIDVDTYRGTKLGVPELCRLLKHHGIQGSFFFSVGPDNMGRNLWRLLSPAFLKKMLRSNAPNLYGWDILLRGTCWPGPLIAEKLGDVIADTAAQGHEIGLHAWDHYRWQTRAEKLPAQTILEESKRGLEKLQEIVGMPVASCAAPAWKCNPAILEAREALSLTYASDTRGNCIFYPTVGERTFRLPQIPTTLPTYDEIIGQHGICDENYNAYLLDRVIPNQLNVLTIHAEVEGIAKASLFADFLEQALAHGVEIIPLRELLARHQKMEKTIPELALTSVSLPGRDGWVASHAGYKP